MIKAFVLIKNGFEEVEALTVVDYLRRAEIDIKIVSTEEDLELQGAHGIKIIADMAFDELDRDDIDLVFLPGGMPGATSLKDDEKVLELITYLNDKGRAISAICAAPIVLEAAGVIEDKTVTSYPSFDEKLPSIGEYSQDIVVIDENIITSRGPATAVYLALELIELLKGRETKEAIRKDILLDLIEDR